MRLPPTDTERFYRVWFGLLYYVNEQLHLVPFFPEAPDTTAVSAEDTMRVRDALWADDALRERFIADNPAHCLPTIWRSWPVGSTASRTCL